MKRAIKTVLLTMLTLSILIAPVAVAMAEPTTDELVQSIDSYVTSQMGKMHAPGIGLGVVRDGQVFYVQGYGVKNPQGDPVEADTPFLLASMTKSFTALAVMQLVEAGQLELDEPVQTYLPWFDVETEGAGPQITVRHLLNQVSGIPTASGLVPPKPDDTLEQRIRDLVDIELSQPVGEVFQYANHNYNALGLLIEKISGLSYGDYVKAHIFQPLQMERSYADQRSAEAAGLSAGYQSVFGLPALAHFEFPMADLPAGILLATPADVAKYLQMYLSEGNGPNGQLLSQAGIASMWQTEKGNPYGMGWIVSGGGSRVEHGGDYYNYSTYMLLEPNEGLGVVILTNMGTILDSGMPQTIAYGVASLLKGEEPAKVNGTAMWMIPSLLALWALKNLFDILVTPRWWLRAGQKPTAEVTGKVYIPNIARAILGAILFGAARLMFGVSLPVLIALQPDVAYLVVVNAVLLIATAVTRIGLYFKNSRQGLAA